MQLVAHTSLKQTCGDSWSEVSKLLTLNGQNTNRYRVMYAMITQGNVAFLKELIRTNLAEYELFEMHQRVTHWCSFQSNSFHTTSSTRPHLWIDLEQLTDMGYHLCTDISSAMWLIRITSKEQLLFEVDYSHATPCLRTYSQTWLDLNPTQRHAYFRNITNRFLQTQPFSLFVQAG